VARLLYAEGGDFQQLLNEVEHDMKNYQAKVRLVLLCI
jgi:hypothetical protein